MYDKFAKLMAALAVVVLLTASFQVSMAQGMGDYHTKDEILFEYNTQEYKLSQTTSQARLIKEEKLIRKKLPDLSKDSYEVLCRIVQAEAGGEDMLGKQMVADVIINRVKCPKFPGSVEGVVFQGTQFSPVRDGRYYSVTVTAETRKAVDQALESKDSSGGALYFVNAKKADAGKYSWFENSLTFCVEHGGHRFYK